MYLKIFKLYIPIRILKINFYNLLVQIININKYRLKLNTVKIFLTYIPITLVYNSIL